MKLSIVIICWNDLKVIADCLKSIFEQTTQMDFEVIVSDNDSNDGSVAFIKEHFPKVGVVENGQNLGFAKGNNAGIRIASGEYVLVLNPDTIIRDRALEKLVAFADKHPEAGAFGCRVLNPDGSYQHPARPLPTLWRYLLAALGLRWGGRFSTLLLSDTYTGWDGRTEKEIGFQSGCCVMFRGDLLKRLDGFDERFFYHYEETDLCARVWQAGFSVRYFPGAEIVHLGGQSVRRFPIRFALETYRSGYRYFFKYYGRNGIRWIRQIYLLRLRVRQFGYSLLNLFQPSESLQNRLAAYRVSIRWNRLLDPIRFIENGQEPDLGYAPLAPAPILTQRPVLPVGSR